MSNYYECRITQERGFYIENLDFGHLSNFLITLSSLDKEFLFYLCNKFLHPEWSDLLKWSYAI